LIASFSVPLLGSALSHLGESYFELLLMASLALIFSSHITYLNLSDTQASTSMIQVLPLVPFGFGHALFTTLQGPIVPKIVPDKTQLSASFNLIKITESLGVTIFIWLAGYIRHATDSFTGVTIMMMFCTIVAMAATYQLIEETKAVGY